MPLPPSTTLWTWFDRLTSLATLLVAAIVAWTLVQPAPQLPSEAAKAPSLPVTWQRVEGLETYLDSRALGSQEAKVILLEYSDFQCPFCSRYARTTYPSVKSDFVDSGKIQYVSRHFPLDMIHPRALEAAQASECAAVQGHGWEMRTVLFQDPSRLDRESLSQNASKLQLDLRQFADCMAGPSAEQIQRDIQEGKRLGVQNTPTFFVGALQPRGRVRILRKLVGAQEYRVFSAMLDEMVKATL